MLFRSAHQPPLIEKRGKDDDDEGFIEAAKSYALKLRNFYDIRARWHRRFYRISGILVILGGSSLPVISTQHFAEKDLAVSLVGVAISAITALRAFYRWDTSWILLRNTEAKTSSIYFSWKAKYESLAAGKAITERSRDPEQYKVTVDMIEQLMNIRQEEASSFFRDLPFPHK